MRPISAYKELTKYPFLPLFHLNRYAPERIEHVVFHMSRQSDKFGSQIYILSR